MYPILHLQKWDLDIPAPLHLRPTSWGTVSLTTVSSGAKSKSYQANWRITKLLVTSPTIQKWCSKSQKQNSWHPGKHAPHYTAGVILMFPWQPLDIENVVVAKWQAMCPVPLQHVPTWASYAFWPVPSAPSNFSNLQCFLHAPISSGHVNGWQAEGKPPRKHEPNQFVSTSEPSLSDASMVFQSDTMIPRPTAGVRPWPSATLALLQVGWKKIKRNRK